MLISPKTSIKIIVEKNPNTSLTFLIERKNVVFIKNIIPNDHFHDIYKKNVGRIGVTALSGELQKLHFHEAVSVGLGYPHPRYPRV